MKRSILLAATAIAALSACDGLKEALTAHVDVVARAGSQELSVNRLADMLAKTKVPLNKEVAQTVADVWTDYQLVARAAAHGDSLDDPKLIDEVMWPAISQTRIRKWYDQVSKTWPVDTSPATWYASGDILAASHILLTTPQGSSVAQQDSVKRKAEALRSQVTAANFADMAKKNSGDPGSAQQGGSLGVFRKGQMVGEFEKGLVALKPGEISQPVQSPYGYHIIRRPMLSEVPKEQIGPAAKERGMFVAESTYLSKVEKAGEVKVKPNAGTVVKSVAQDLDAHLKDKTTIATSKLGDFTAGDAARWITGFPNPVELRRQIQTAPDTLIPQFVTSLVRNELLLHQADSAKVQLDSSDVKEMRRAFVSSLTNMWAGLGVTPKALADSAKTVAERERLAATRVDDYLAKVVAGEAQFLPIPSPVDRALKEKYDAKVNAAGIERAVERAIQLRASADSTHKSQQPPTAVPMPGQGAAPSPQPQPARPQPAQPKKP